MSEALFDLVPAPKRSDDVAAKALMFCERAPHRIGDYSKRNWGGPLHSLCSYQGKLKPSIAHFLVQWFTVPGQRVLDPMGGVGTIPLEARRLGRVGLSSDLSPLADAVSRAKLEPFDHADVSKLVRDLEAYLTDATSSVDVSEADFGLNGPISAYFHEDTLREVLLARQYFLNEHFDVPAPARDVVKSSLLHILHGNRPYALSRRSHPVTPFAPTGPSVYRPLIDGLQERLERVVPHLKALSSAGPPGKAYLADFRQLHVEESVDAVVTSPPFSKSIRFWTSNWMRMWFAGWTPADFKEEPRKFLEVEQRKHFGAYREFAESMARVLKPGGLLVMHLGETTTTNMAAAIQPMLCANFDIRFVGRESVVDTESHGLRDKGSTVAHWYIFATAKG